MPSGSVAGPAALQSTLMAGSRRLVCKGPTSSGVAGTTQGDLPAVAAGKECLQPKACRQPTKVY